jgi:hypothetical protein
MTGCLGKCPVLNILTEADSSSKSMKEKVEEHRGKMLKTEQQSTVLLVDSVLFDMEN